MTAKNLKNLLEKNNIKYVSIAHSPAYTAQDIAQLSHITSGKMAKTVIIKSGKGHFMAVIPGDKKIDLEKLKKTSNVGDAQLADETEFKNDFSDCEIGAMPPFGNLYNMPVYVDDSLGKSSEICFNAGNHHEIIKMNYKDFESLAKPNHGNFIQ